jgi:aldehyde:ferredoxin oxidoreductase
LPWRLLNEPVPDGPNAGYSTSQEELDRMLDEYYDMHGWDRETAQPTADTLSELGLELCMNEGRASEAVIDQDVEPVG